MTDWMDTADEIFFRQFMPTEIAAMLQKAENTGFEKMRRIALDGIDDRADRNDLTALAALLRVASP